MSTRSKYADLPFMCQQRQAGMFVLFISVSYTSTPSWGANIPHNLLVSKYYTTTASVSEYKNSSVESQHETRDLAFKQNTVIAHTAHSSSKCIGVM